MEDFLLCDDVLKRIFSYVPDPTKLSYVCWQFNNVKKDVDKEAANAICTTVSLCESLADHGCSQLPERISSDIAAVEVLSTVYTVVRRILPKLPVSVQEEIGSPSVEYIYNVGRLQRLLDLSYNFACITVLSKYYVLEHESTIASIMSCGSAIEGMVKKCGAVRRIEHKVEELPVVPLKMLYSFFPNSTFTFSRSTTECRQALLC